MTVLCKIVGDVDIVGGDVQLAAVPNVGDAVRVTGHEGVLFVHQVTHVVQGDSAENDAPYVELLIRSRMPGLAVEA